MLNENQLAQLDEKIKKSDKIEQRKISETSCRV